MRDANIVRRVEMLEETVSALRSLPSQVGALEVRMAGVEPQILQLRTEMRDEFSAVRQDLKEMGTRQDLLDVRAELREDIAGAIRDLSGHILESEQRSDRRTRALFEDVIARIAMMGDRRPGA